MNFDWSHFLYLAFELVGRPGKRANREARLRTVISRAYYAAFIEARNHLVKTDKHPIPVGVNPHEYVQLQYRRSSDITRQEIAKRLDTLRRYRNQSDYQDIVPGSLQHKADKALVLANWIVTRLGRL